MNFDNFFYYASKAIVIFSIFIIILALIIKFNEKNEKKNIKIYPTPTINLFSNNQNKIGINLNERWICFYKLENDEYQLNIDKRKITLEATISGQFKKYDLSSYSFFIENMLNMDINQLEFIAKPYLPKGVDLKTLINSCKKIKDSL